MSSFFVGIDVSKDSSSAQGIDSSGNKNFYLSFTMNAQGFSELLAEINSHCGDFSRVMIAMESTGCYHMNLYSFLTSKGINTVIINPLLIANFSKLSLRKTKTDKKDAHTIARFVLAHNDSLSHIALSQEKQDLKDLARERESLTVIIAATKNDIKRILQTTFPELESITNLFSQTILSFLKKYPSARLISATKPKNIDKALIHTDKRKRVSISAEEIINTSKASVGSHSIAKEYILPEKIDTLFHLIEKQDKMTKMLVKFCESVAIGDLDIVKSIKGISDKTGATFLAEAGEITNFASSKKIIAFAGIDPSIRQSGKFEGKSRISKRGNRHLRRVVDAQ